MTVSVLIPSRGRPDKLERCLVALEAQTLLPDQVIVVWQADDVMTRDRAIELSSSLSIHIQIIHSPEIGVVPAENAALKAATGELIALIDDDAIAPPEWVAKFTSHFIDPTLGAVGGPAVNHREDGTRFPIRNSEPVGRFPWHGRAIGNMYDHPPEWQTRDCREVDHLVGYNMVLRRIAFSEFESKLRPYWQMFELDVCLKIKKKGFRILFDFSNIVAHFPNNTVFAGGRDCDLRIKVFNSAYNRSFILAKHSPIYLMPIRFFIQFAIGSLDAPGILACWIAWRRYGDFRRELVILWGTQLANIEGWIAGIRNV